MQPDLLLYFDIFVSLLLLKELYCCVILQSKRVFTGATTRKALNEI